MDEVGDAERAAPRDRHHPPVAQHRAAIGERHHLLQPMRDIDDRGALRLHAREHGEQARDLAAFERGGRLVEDEDATLAPQRLGDGDQLPLGEAQAIDAHIGVRREIKLSKVCARLFAHPGAIDGRKRAQHQSHRQVAEHDVLGDRERRHQAQFLRNGDDARRDGLVRGREAA